MDRHTAESICRLGRSFFDRGLTHGRTGNISVRLGDTVLLTPTGGSLGSLRPEDLAAVGIDGTHLGGGRPSKEAFLHLAMYRARPADHAVVHLHSTHAVAVSCLVDVDVDDRDVLPPLTPYYLMRVGTLPRLPFHAPGDETLGPMTESVARRHHALLLANHGPIVSGPDLATAADAIEELEETARLFLLLQGTRIHPLPPAALDGLRRLHDSSNSPAQQDHGVSTPAQPKPGEAETAP
jgi:ribulose-5-phosphate 4-epimerase/fuculose-1-phosphate aldolase